MIRSLLLVLALASLAFPYTWTQVTVTNSGYGSLTRVPGGYSMITAWKDTVYGIDLCDAGGGFPHPNIYQNCTWKFTAHNSTRTLLDTNWWTHNDGASRTYDTIPNLTDNTPPNRHFIFAATDSGVLFTAAGLNNKVMVNRVFHPDSVNLATNEISFASTTPFTHLDEVDFVTSGALPTGLSTGTSYWVIYVSPTKLKFASSFANARAGTAIDLNTSTGSGVDSLRRVVANHPNDVWTKNLASPTTWTQIHPPADSMPAQSGVLPAMVYDKYRRYFIVTNISDNRGGSSQRTYLLNRDSPYDWSRLTQSYQNGDAPGVSSGQGCAFNTRDSSAYCFGGGNSSNPTQTVWKFNGGTQLWTKPTWTGLPRARVQHCVEYIPGASAATDSLFISGGAASEGGTEYTDSFMCSIQNGACDSLPLASVPTAAAFTYCKWISSSAKIVLRKADTSPSTVDEFWTMPMGTAQTEASATPAFRGSLLGVGK